MAPSNSTTSTALAISRQLATLDNAKAGSSPQPSVRHSLSA
ncbi:hypothetical protein JCM10207_007236 [Rhodosporidiobolus poonsookiae]